MHLINFNKFKFSHNVSTKIKDKEHVNSSKNSTNFATYNPIHYKISLLEKYKINVEKCIYYYNAFSKHNTRISNLMLSFV